ncbi:MAG: TfoX/Sxy family protein [Alphaproteobacteria bacterium]|jgi:TfoX/Sxy family transcriptional regulator of competence genes|nr:TfoX/Sxy family protein [Alphaproteobacteria bacterium]MBT4018192.1 TfoX/Sxy family protein [Alphaproteobacteria bacterium]MBT4965081.1 TfoX/Sxy family protein [Alphaproteobacteria bacterium]MBT5160761.1 TfoX/Sxy family protein [Alphaproteobacteria bacterium]MBT6386992.1 TfoX/Sxy family protein [Alphaproteobacteria bacterium]
MAQPWLSDLQALADTLALHGDITCKHFFSGAAAYKDGQIFMSLSPAGLALKLPEQTCADLISKGAKPLKYFANSPAKKGYAVLPDNICEDDKALHKLISLSLEYIGQ